MKYNKEMSELCMRQTNVCINRIFKFYIKFVFRELTRTLCAREKSVRWKLKEKKERKKDKNDGRFIQDY